MSLRHSGQRMRVKLTAEFPQSLAVPDGNGFAQENDDLGISQVVYGFAMQSVTTAQKIGRSSSPLPKRFNAQATVPLSSCSRKL